MIPILYLCGSHTIGGPEMKFVDIDQFLIEKKLIISELTIFS